MSQRGFNRGRGRRALVLAIVFVTSFLIASTVYRERSSWAEPDRGFAREGLDIQNSLPMVQQPKGDLPIRVLSLDAGGIRGILELHVLAHMEKVSGKPASELFDLIVGTSTGSAITIGLLLPGEDGKPKFTAEELLHLYVEQVHTFSDVPWYHTVMTLDGLIGPRYSIGPSRDFARRHYGEVTMSELIGDAIVATLDLETLEPKFLASRQSEFSGGRTLPENFLAVDTVMACCSVPAYVPPMVLRDVSGREAFVAVDGGAFAFAPALFAVNEAMNRYPGRRIALLSLGTGSVQGGWSAQDARSWGTIDWATATVPLVLRSQVRYVEELLAKTAVVPDSILVDYLRLSPVLPADLEASLVTSPEMIPRLEEMGRELVKTRHRDIQAMLGSLQGN